MPGFLGYYGLERGGFNPASAVETIDPIGLCEVRTFESEYGICAVSWLKLSPIPTRRYHEDPGITACFAGDLIGTAEIPWELIVDILEKSDYKRFADFRGAFAVSVYDKKNNKIFVISDRISQQPVYFYSAGSVFLYSTALPFFCRSPHDFQFNEMWLRELLFFNYPVGETTFLENVVRMPPASILVYDLDASRYWISSYAEPFRKRGTLIRGAEALSEAVSVFEDRMPAYFDSEERIAISLTGGFDSRTVLSYAPQERTDTYTYGIQGSGDFEAGLKIAFETGMKHHSIEFGEDFLAELHQLIESTVYLSGGSVQVVRSILPYVYRTLTANGTRYPVIVTGVSGDHLFRDHIKGSGNVPFIISPDMMTAFRTGHINMEKEFYQRIFGERYTDFASYIMDVYEQLKRRHGELQAPESYLSYLIYEVTPRYFGGEAEIATNFSAFRTPFWDADIIQLAHDIEYSTLGFSEALPAKDTYRECVMQAVIISNNKRLAHIPINGVPLKLYAADNKLLYHLARTIMRAPHKIMSMLRRPVYIPPEDWSHWLRVVLDKQPGSFVSRESFVSEYLEWDFIEGIKHSNDTYWLGKVLTAEIVLQLISKDWKL